MPGADGEERVRGARRDGAEHADAGCEQVDVAAGGREGARASRSASRRRRRGRPAPSSAAGYEARLPLWPPLPAAATSSTPCFVAYLTAARSVGEVCEPLEAQVDDACAVVDGPDDAGGLVDVGERRAAARLDDHQPSQPGRRSPRRATRRTFRDRPCRRRRSRRGDVVGDRLPGGERGRRQVGARVDDGDRDRGGAVEHRHGYLVEMRRGASATRAPQRSASGTAASARVRGTSARTKRMPGRARRATRVGHVDGRDVERGDARR